MRESASSRRCAQCNAPLPTSDRRRPGLRREYCDARCRKLAFVAKRASQRDLIGDIYADEVNAAIRRGDQLALDAHEALELRVAPSERARAAIAVRELVARTLAALDSGRIDLARRTAGPIARDIFVELEADRKATRGA
jgi:hypothetical protein